jgi:Tol biopolymer transport system component
VASTLAVPHRQADARARALRAPLFAAAAAVAVTAAVFALFGTRLGLIRDGAGDGAPLVLGALTPVTTEQGLEIDPSVSPDGSLVAYASGPPVRGARDLAEAPGYVFTCDWAEAGGRIACAYGNLILIPGRQFGNLAPSGILTVPAAGGDAVPLVAPEDVNYSPVWAPGGRSLYFVSNRQGVMDIYTVGVSADGRAEAEPRRITTGLGAWWIDLTADGRHLAYSTFVMRGNIWSMPIPSRETDTSEVTPLTQGNQLVESMRVSPDQRWLVYDSTIRRSSDIFRIPLTGGEPAELASDSADEFAADLSPDGREVAYHAYVSGSCEIFVKPVDGGPARQITAVPSAQESWPRWTPDGRAIVYRDQGPGGGLFLLRRSSAGAWGVPESLRPEAAWLGAWLPDGRAVYPRHGAVEVISIDTRKVQVVYAPAADAADPKAEMVASVDGRTLYFKSHDAAGRAAIWSVPSSGGRPARLVRFLDTHSSLGSELAAGAGRFFFRLEDHQADVWVADITLR